MELICCETDILILVLNSVLPGQAKNLIFKNRAEYCLFLNSHSHLEAGDWQKEVLSKHENDRNKLLFAPSEPVSVLIIIIRIICRILSCCQLQKVFKNPALHFSNTNTTQILHNNSDWFGRMLTFFFLLRFIPSMFCYFNFSHPPVVQYSHFRHSFHSLAN